jgi:hypothetical protein
MQISGVVVVAKSGARRGMTRWIAVGSHHGKVRLRARAADTTHKVGRGHSRRGAAIWGPSRP